MKAAVLHQLGRNPVYEDFDAPVPNSENEVLINVKAFSLKNLDKGKAAGKHYTSYPSLPVVVGIDGAGILEDGTKTYAWGKTGMLAEQALVENGKWAIIPDRLDFETAAALPNALVGSDAALLYRAGFQPGQTVLINGATGFTGKVAIQMAKLRGAAKVIVTGRNQAILEELKALGADEVISLSQEDSAIIKQIQESHAQTPIDIVLDYVWGHPVELILDAFKSLPPRRLKIVTIGNMAGANISLQSALLRSTQIEFLGSGIGSIPFADIHNYMEQELPKVFELAAKGKIKIDLEMTELKDVETVWSQTEKPGSRIVIKI
ncbi:zinc-binding alcohol dehydrogenase family protein [Flavobacterium sp. DG1-102-2]|uniref:quinone oxidoreductase family protein n=1 Tax=Flavobacterium sp. DG1-102-2 TaxID=3081663 RepID=UPI00294A76E8|nr:zinc-binding alcohol dehydrogenase family protein [Flavobacterium sp. DG1-102-2]MDV6167994.1 zinc-binding alcohol dehydrogenase family protein [Flavobacterium sp. DG1-102-2]